MKKISWHESRIISFRFFSKKKTMKKPLSYSDKSIYSYFPVLHTHTYTSNQTNTHTHTRDMISCSEVSLQSASDCRLTADGCDLICLLLPAAQPNLHNIIALFGKLITAPPLVVEETMWCSRQPNDPPSLFWNEHVHVCLLLHRWTSFSTSISKSLGVAFTSHQGNSGILYS